jgi:hypothetical protein
MFVCFLSVQPTLLYNGYKEHTKNIEVTMEGYMEAQKADLDDFYDATHLQYGKASFTSIL